LKRRKRVALYGGSFDPIHSGHEAVVKLVLAQNDVDECWIVPARVNPLKGKRPASGQHRAAMIRRLFASEISKGRVRVITWELERTGKSYTFHTLEHLSSANPGIDFLWCMGADQRMRKWYKAEELCQLVDFLIVSRPDNPGNSDEIFRGIKAKPRYRMLTLDVRVSSTAIRKAFGSGRVPARALGLPRTVREYIQANSLYNQKETSPETQTSAAGGGDATTKRTALSVSPRGQPVSTHPRL